VDRTLRILGVPRREPSLDALRELVAAYVTRVPFENVSKIHRWKRFGLTTVPELPVFLDGIERFGFGGTCYANNYHLHRLLVDLGYRATLCGAEMSRPDVHLVSIVAVEGREYLVDAGYGAPFLAPLPRDLARDHEIVLGPERYILKPQDAGGRSRLELHRDGRQRHGYIVGPEPRRIEEFARVIEESFADTAVFMNTLVAALFGKGRSVVLRNLTLIESEGTRFQVSRVASRDRLPEVIEERFGIPKTISREALDGLALSHDAWG
jgi:arylamine N-acetyltransferase